METVSGGKQEIFYSQIVYDPIQDDFIQSPPFNVSNSPSLNSSSLEFVVDSTGTAHIIWQDQDQNGSDHYEVLYSQCYETDGVIICTSPATLTDGQNCSFYEGDWKAFDPTIGIDADDRLMAVWTSYEPGPIRIMYSLWDESEQPPASRTGCHPLTGYYSRLDVAGDSNGDFHMLLSTAGWGSALVYYSQFSGTSWTTNTEYLGDGKDQVIYIDQNNKVHAAWDGYGTPPKYRTKEEGAASWSTAEEALNINCGDVSLITDGNYLPRLTCSTNGLVYETSRQPEGWTEAAIIAGNGIAGSAGAASQPSLSKDSFDNLYLVWTDFRTGNGEIFYSPSYSCEGIANEPATDAGKAVLVELQKYQPVNDFKRLNYCKNKVEKVIYVPAPGGEDDPNEAFQQWADLASSAKHEVAFTVMFWDDAAISRKPG